MQNNIINFLREDEMYEEIANILTERDSAYQSEQDVEENIIVKRKVIYVDASYQRDEKLTTISLYEKATGTGQVLKVKNEEFTISHNSDAEALAVFNAILYIREKDYKKAIILCDNESIIKKYDDYEKGIKVTWIPREINVIADKLTKLPNNTSQDKINLLKYLFLKTGKII